MLTNTETTTLITPLKDVPINDVILLDQYYINAFNKEMTYLLEYDIERLIWHFRDTARLKDKKDAQSYPGWENTAIRGHITGHYMSAVARAYTSTTKKEKEKLFEKLSYLLQQLRLCQEAYEGKKGANGSDLTGYLSAYPDSHLENLETGFWPGEGVWVPWYTMHKILQGLIDVYTFVKEDTLNKLAYKMATELGTYISHRVNTWAPTMKRRVLNVEFGGMNDCLYQLYRITQDDQYLKAAHQFDEYIEGLNDWLYSNIMEKGADALTGYHANTMIPKIVGSLQRYIALNHSEKESYYLEVAKKFWEIVTTEHSFITGGNSRNEHFGSPNTQASYLNNNETCETCNTYNMLKLSRELFKITGDKKYADYYERTFINAIVSSQNPDTGMTMYFQPMGVGFYKLYSTPFNEFWCCTGSGLESMSKLNDSIYFTNKAKELLYVNMFISSSIKIPENNFMLTQNTDIPATDLTTFTINALNHTSPIKSMAIKFRIPDWIADAPTLTINGIIQDNTFSNVEDYIVIEKEWEDGDIIEITYPSKIHAHTLSGSNAVAFKYGPLVLSSELGKINVTDQKTGIMVRAATRMEHYKDYITVNNITIEKWLENLEQNLIRTDIDGTLQFELRGTDEDGKLVFSPHYQRHGAFYGLYYQLVEEDSKEIQSYIINNKRNSRLKNAEISSVKIGNDQYEFEKNLIYQASDTGVWSGVNFRHANPKDGWFSYDLEVNTSGIDNYIVMTFASNDHGRCFNIEISGKEHTQKISPYTIQQSDKTFYQYTLKIDKTVLSDAKNKIHPTTKQIVLDDKGNPIPVVTLKLSAYDDNNFVGSLFGELFVVTSFSNVPTLKDLTFDVGVWDKDFESNLTEYTITVPENTEHVIMNASLLDTCGLLYINDILIHDHLQRRIPLTGDVTKVVLKTYAEDHQTTIDYTILFAKAKIK